MERGFSDSGKTVTVNRNRLSEASVSNLRIAKVEKVEKGSWKKQQDGDEKIKQI